MTGSSIQAILEAYLIVYADVLVLFLQPAVDLIGHTHSAVTGPPTCRSVRVSSLF